uniref:ARAD1D19360p n=1 Tax=Blastobotrys adeninivorans TaxID=409370 RepID=A0A060TAH7_BLAAD
MGLLAALFLYLLGGITFIPGVVALIWAFSSWYLPDVEQSSIKDDLGQSAERDRDQDSEGASLLEKELETGVDVYQAGWLTVSREYFIYPSGGPKNTGNPPPASSMDASIKESESAYSSLYKLVNKTSTSSELGSAKGGPTASTTTLGPDSPSDNNSNNKKKKSKLQKYFAVLRHGNLFLYDDADQSNVKHVIVIANHVVSVWPPKQVDGQLFVKRSAICLAKMDFQDIGATEELLSDPNQPPHDAFFLYSENCSEKEDFYFALIRASKLSSHWKCAEELAAKRELPDYWRIDPSIMADPLHYKTQEIMSLIQTIHSSDANLQTRWFNAFTGRLFLAIKDTPVIEQYFRRKIVDKLGRIKRPNFIEEIEVRKIHMGHSVPIFTNNKLRELTPDGLLVIEANMHYNGGFQVMIATKAVLNLGARFKSRDVDLVLSVTVQSVEGKIVFKMKPPPSNRIWYAFETMPKMTLRIEPVVSSKQITYSMVTKAIDNKFREAFKDTLVLPNMDDLTFLDTSSEFYRGGIWSKSNRPDEEGLHDEQGGHGTESPEEPEMARSTGTESPKELRHRQSTADISTMSRSNTMGSVASSVSSYEEGEQNGGDFDAKTHIGELKHMGSAPKSPQLEPTKATAAQRSAQFVGSVKRWGNWYIKEKLGNRANTGHARGSSDSSTDTASTARPKPAPQAHQFPPEMLSALNQSPDLRYTTNPYGPIPDMKIPGVEQIHEPPSSFPKRRPVAGDSESAGESVSETVGETAEETVREKESEKEAQGQPESQFGPPLESPAQDLEKSQSTIKELPEQPEQLPEQAQDQQKDSGPDALGNDGVRENEQGEKDSKVSSGTGLGQVPLSERSHRQSAASSTSSTSTSSTDRKVSVVSYQDREGLILDDSRSTATISSTNKSTAVGFNGTRSSRTVKRKPVPGTVSGTVPGAEPDPRTTNLETT